MQIRPRVLATTVGLTAVLAGVPAVALAATSSSAPASSSSASSSSSCPRQDRHQAVAAYVAAHPDLAAEQKTLKALPADQRAAARKTWFTAHPDERRELTEIRAQAMTDLAERLAAAEDKLAAHPDLAALQNQLHDAGSGQRAQVVRTYLKAHPGSAAEVRSVLAALRGGSSGCHAGS